jgi:nicotinamide phosphoribosyltransferase
MKEIGFLDMSKLEVPNRPCDYTSKRGVEYYWYPEWIRVLNGEGVDVYKDPVTDKGKTSKRGILDLVLTHNLSTNKSSYKTVRGTDQVGSVLKTVFENGKVTKTYTLDQIRKIAAEHT